MSGSSGTVSFKSVESRFSFNRCATRWKPSVCGRRWGVRFWPNVEKEWVRKRKGVLLDVEGEGAHQICSFMWADNSWIMQLLKDLIEEAGKVELEPKPASLWWRSTHASEEEEDIILGTSKGCYDFLFEDEIQDTGMCNEPSRENVRCCRRTNAVSKQGLLEGHTVSVRWTTWMPSSPLEVNPGRGRSERWKQLVWKRKQ